MAHGDLRRTLAAKVVDCCVAKAQTGTPSVRFALRSEYDIANPGVPEIRNVYADLWLSFKCVERTFKTLKEVFGWTGKDGSLDVRELNDGCLAGKRVNAVVEPDDRDPDKLKVIFLNRPSALQHAPEEEVGAIANEVSDMLLRLRGAQVDLHPGTPQQAAASSANSSLSNDQSADLPF